ncbi:MAG: TonB-dependent receptor [Gammaproteobacteria bacterium]|nr:TonB-dependent receptor [Gammaproteobacteria bacterium]NNC97851.1 TonB-dependent receptor [Gammaproteobacteria bacterium]NNM14700.1 TonB-dependent receptor [Gammaproteobacteria bacterium]
MKQNWKKISLVAAVAASMGLLQSPTYAADNVIEEVITIGTRSAKPRTAADSTVPVDVISAEDFNALGSTADLTDNLKAAIPSYTATPATGDGSAFVRPTSLRGTAPDQTLVLVDGKRRHRSALVQFFAPAAGNGAHGVDVGMIPGIALKSVEVLRDGAASQYGSDAIAGVINFVTKDASEGGELQVQYGEHYEGETSTKFAANAGFAAGENGFINASIEYVDNEALSRGIQRPVAQALIDEGVMGVGQDAVFGDAPLVQTWGRPETSGTRIFVNSGVELAGGSELYGRIGYADTDGRYRFFYRNGILPSSLTDPADPCSGSGHSTLIAICNSGFSGNLLNTGYTPYLDGAQNDLSLVAGRQGEFAGGTSYDFSIGYGKNELDYTLNNTLNGDLALVGGQPQRDFDVGGYEQAELNLNADFSRPISDTLNVAYGVEWREETYTAFAGEPNSYEGGGSSGFRGITPESSGEFDRDNIAVYGDVEHDVSDALLMQYALRYEDFSDFGSTVNGKVAARYRVNDALALRGAVSTGFHAPTPGQSNVSTIITTFDGATGLQVEEGLIPATDPAAISAGGAPLKEEESTNLSLGFTTSIGDNTNLTVDYYNIDVADRIYRTGDIQIADPAAPGGERTISFYTNAIDVEHSGVDVVLTSAFDWSSYTSTDLTFAYSYNKVDVTDQKQIPTLNDMGATVLVAPVSTSTVEDIENNYPNSRFTLTANTDFGDRWNMLVRANYYGAHYDERGTIGAASNPSAEIDATTYFDAELGFQYTENLKFSLGAVNIFDEYIDEVGPPNANRLSVGLQYPRRSAANYEGGSWYFKTSYKF